MEWEAYSHDAARVSVDTSLPFPFLLGVEAVAAVTIVSTIYRLLGDQAFSVSGYADREQGATERWCVYWPGVAFTIESYP